MPSVKHVEIHVVDKKGEEFYEYGVQKHERAGIVSCYIESQAEKRFQIALTANKRMIFPPKPKREVPWHFIATRRIDGKETSERRKFIFLDSNHSSSTVMQHKTVRQANGRLHYSDWIFKDVNLDKALSTLGISGEDEEDGGVLLDTAEGGFSAGQIEITLERIIPGFERGLAGPENYDVFAGSSVPPSKTHELSHLVAHDIGKKKYHRKRVLQFQMFIPGEKPYAKFKFYYRSKDVLRGFGFPEFAPANPPEKVLEMKRKAAALVDSWDLKGERAEMDEMDAMRKKVKAETDDDSEEIEEDSAELEEDSAAAEEESDDVAEVREKVTDMELTDYEVAQMRKIVLVVR